MIKVKTKIPVEQKEILIDALSILEVALRALKTEEDAVHYKIFDIQTLKALFRESELEVSLPLKNFNEFTHRNGIDFPNYIDNATK